MENIEKKRRIERLAVQTAEGQTRVLGAESPRPTLLVFFSLNCSSCLEAAPVVSEQLATYRDRLQLLGVGRDHTAEELQAWQAERGTHFELVADPDRALFERFAKLHVPRFYLIDTMGRVRYQDVNWHPLMMADMKRAVQELLD